MNRMAVAAENAPVKAAAGALQDALVNLLAAMQVQVVREPGMIERKPLLVDLQTAGQEMQVSRAVLFRLLMTGEIASVKLGKRRLIPYKELESWIERNAFRGLSA